MILGLQAHQGWFKFLSHHRQNQIAGHSIRSPNIVPSDPERPIKFLSGGNQQKASLARWLASEPEFLIPRVSVYRSTGDWGLCRGGVPGSENRRRIVYCGPGRQ